jgi:hypothetical protein
MSWQKETANAGFHFCQYVEPEDEKVSSRASGTFKPHRRARSFAVFSQAPQLVISFRDGNLAIQSCPSSSVTEAFGLAPPRATSISSHFSGSESLKHSQAFAVLSMAEKTVLRRKKEMDLRSKLESQSAHTSEIMNAKKKIRFPAFIP